jgi:hypothetical protein
VADHSADTATILNKKGKLLQQSEINRMVQEHLVESLRLPDTPVQMTSDEHENHFEQSLAAFQESLEIVQQQRQHVPCQSSQYLSLMDLESDILGNIGVVYARIPSRLQDALRELEHAIMRKMEKVAQGGAVGMQGVKQVRALLEHARKVRPFPS